MALDVRQGLGTSIAVKIGSRYPSINDWRHYQNLRHGHVIEIREQGYIPNHDKTRYHNLVIDLPNVKYWQIRGSTNWKSTKSGVLYFKKFMSVANEHGSYVWNSGLGKHYKAKMLHGKEKKREWLIDPEWLLAMKYISLEQWESIYDKSRPHEPIVLNNVFTLEQIIKHEDEWTRYSNEKDQSKGSISSGTYQIGTGVGADYATWPLYVADWDSQQTDDLIGEGQNEETAITAVLKIDIDTNGYNNTITAESGAEHNGAAYGNGARINMGSSYDYINYDETNAGDLAGCEFSKIAIDASGSNEYGLVVTDVGGAILLNRNLIKSGASAGSGISLFSSSGMVVSVRNNIVYSSGSSGIVFTAGYNGCTFNFYNNTCCKNDENFVSEHTGTSDTINFDNNLAQDAGSADYRNDGAGWGTNAKNISEDLTSPNTSYRSKDLHTNTVFEDFSNDDYRIDKDGDSTSLAILDDGEDLSGIFTDDINHSAGRRP